MMKTGMLILLMAAGILTASLRTTSGPEDEERSQLEKPLDNKSTTPTNQFKVVDEDIVEELHHLVSSSVICQLFFFVFVIVSLVNGRRHYFLFKEKI